MTTSQARATLSGVIRPKELQVRSQF